MIKEEKFSVLSRAEKRILIALASGSLYKEIADDCNVSVNTVKKHLKNIYRKLNLHKRTQVIQAFFDNAVTPVLRTENTSS